MRPDAQTLPATKTDDQAVLRWDDRLAGRVAGTRDCLARSDRLIEQAAALLAEVSRRQKARSLLGAHRPFGDDGRR